MQFGDKIISRDGDVHFSLFIFGEGFQGGLVFFADGRGNKLPFNSRGGPSPEVEAFDIILNGRNDIRPAQSGIDRLANQSDELLAEDQRNDDRNH